MAVTGFSVYPAGMGYRGFSNPTIRLLKGGSEHLEGGFSIEHWSPSTGVSTIAQENRGVDAWCGSNTTWLAQPQLGVDQAGNLYCLYTRFDETDTTRVQGQQRFTWGPLSRGEIWGAMSANKGATWFESVNLSKTRGEDERHVGVSDLNPSDAVHVIYQTDNIASSAVNDHTTWVNAEIRYWAIPASQFSRTPQPPAPPEIYLSEGVLDFLNTAGTATRSFTISNRGGADLVVDDVFAVDPQFTASPRSFTIAPGANQEVTITYKARVATRDTMGLVGIPNNDPISTAAAVILATATTTSVARANRRHSGELWTGTNYQLDLCIRQNRVRGGTFSNRNSLYAESQRSHSNSDL
jgi:hypothetical protein